MRKLIFVLVFSTSIAVFAPVAFAQTACPSGNDGDCPGSQECDTSVTPYVCVNPDAGAGAGNLNSGSVCTTDGQCEGNLACIKGICQIDPSLEDTGTSAVGGSCNPTDANSGNSDCPGGQTCSATGATTGTCVGATNTGATSASINGGFQPLAPIPGLTQGLSVNNSGLAGFLQNLYKYLIGIAAVLAVIQIIRGGLEYATQDSVSKKDDGKKHIQQAIMGLVLVLAPALVFGIINPSILNLSVNLPPIMTANGTAAAPSGTTAPAAVNGQVGGTYLQKLTTSNASQAQAFQSSCTSSGGKYTTSCPTSNTQNGQPTCSTVSDECEMPAPQGYTFLESSNSSSQVNSLLTRAEVILGATTLVPDSQSQLSSFSQFYNQCQSDGGEVCVPASAGLSVQGPLIGPGCAGDPISYSVPNAVAKNPTCVGATPICVDPVNSGSDCNSSWTISQTP